MIPSLTLRDTRLTCNLQLCAMKSPEGYVKGTPYTMRNTSQYVTLNDNVFLDAPSIVASRINETQQSSLSGARSFKTQISYITLNENVSPVVDISSMGVICNANRINGLDSLNAQTITPTQNAEGELNAMTYVTKRVNLKQPASSIKVMLDGFSPLSTDLKVMYKILLNDESTPFDDVGYNFFNSDGSPDTTVEKDGKNFKEYEYTVEDLPEFTSFAIKIVGQSHNTSVVPLVSNLRAIISNIMKELARVKGEQHLYRDEESGAIISDDSQTLAIYKKRKTVFQNQINEINTLRQELNEIKDILRNITNDQNS